MVNNEQWVSSADVVFANATCFKPEMIKVIEGLMKTRFRPGQVFMLTTFVLDLPKDDFELVGPLVRQMTWGDSKLRAYIKK